jgi:hypothetical protein
MLFNSVEFKEVRLFIKKSLLFLPIVLLFGFCFAMLYNSGEIIDFNKLVKIHNINKTSIIGFAYSNPDVELKLAATITKKPKILTLGTSRVMQFREGFFTQEFYNAGGGISKLQHYKLFINKFIDSGYVPEYLIIGLDQYFFNENFDKLAFDNEYSKRINQKQFKLNYRYSLKMYLKDMAKGKLNITLFKNDNYIGLNSLLNCNGFRSDGSYYYGGLLKNGVEFDKDFEDTLSRIKDGRSRFEYADEINTKALDEIEALLGICHANNIKVIAIIPPYAPSIYNTMKETQNYKYLDYIYPEVKPCFEKYGYEVYDFTNLENSEDTEFLDGFHGSEVTYLKVLLEMAKNNDDIRKVTDINHLKELLEKRKNNREIG